MWYLQLEAYCPLWSVPLQELLGRLWWTNTQSVSTTNTPGHPNHTFLTMYHPLHKFFRNRWTMAELSWVKTCVLIPKFFHTASTLNKFSNLCAWACLIYVYSYLFCFFEKEFPCSSSWPGTTYTRLISISQRSTCPWNLSAGIKGVQHHTR